MAPIKIALFLAGVSLPFFSQTGAAQQVMCGNYEDVAKAFSERHGETPRYAGIDGRGNMVQVFVSDAGTWTIVAVVNRDGQTLGCPFAEGTGWQDMAHKPGGRKS